jgi:hypothetical protein
VLNRELAWEVSIGLGVSMLCEVSLMKVETSVENIIESCFKW